jgi:hypothetical protein
MDRSQRAVNRQVQGNSGKVLTVKILVEFLLNFLSLLKFSLGLFSARIVGEVPEQI